MAKYCNFKSPIVFEESPLMNNPIIVKVSAVPKGDGTDVKRPASLDVFGDDKSKRIEYLVLKCLTVFVQTLNNMCFNAEMVHLYKNFVPFRISSSKCTGERLVQSIRTNR